MLTNDIIQLGNDGGTVPRDIRTLQHNSAAFSMYEVTVINIFKWIADRSNCDWHDFFLFISDCGLVCGQFFGKMASMATQGRRGNVCYSLNYVISFFFGRLVFLLK
jgi:hypothetical protein